MTYSFRWTGVAILGALIAVVALSSGGGPSLTRFCAVSGLVTYSGQPVPKGKIRFVTSGAHATEGLWQSETKKGAFRVWTVPGKNVVTVSAPDDIPADAVGNGMTIDVPDNGMALEVPLGKPAKK